MSYYAKTTIESENIESAIEKVTASLKEQGFGIITTIDMKTTLKNKLDVDFKPYTILGACNPKFAYKALQAEEEIGVFLPCNVLVKLNEGNIYDVVAVDPVASMMSVDNKDLPVLAGEVKDMLEKALTNL